jgi:hypothetical protein
VGGARRSWRPRREPAAEAEEQQQQQGASTSAPTDASKPVALSVLKNIAVGAGVLLGVALSMDAYAPPPLGVHHR